MSNTLDVYKSNSNLAWQDLATEEELLGLAAKGKSSLFLYTWPDPVVVLGYSQKFSELATEFCRNQKIPMIRRISGGTGVVYNQDLAVSLVLPKEHEWAKDLRRGYAFFLGALRGALESCRVKSEIYQSELKQSHNRSPICFEDQMSETLLIDGKKCVGCAQARRTAGVLIHAAVLLNLDSSLYANVFSVKSSRIEEHLVEVSPKLNAETLAQAVQTAFAKSLSLSIAEKERPPICDKWVQRYQDSHWQR
jgi:lipoate-protein ligase A